MSLRAAHDTLSVYKDQHLELLQLAMQYLPVLKHEFNVGIPDGWMGWPCAVHQPFRGFLPPCWSQGYD